MTSQNDEIDGMCFELSPGVHSTSLGLAPRSVLYPSYFTVIFSEKKNPIELQNCTKVIFYSQDLIISLTLLSKNI